MLEITEIDTVDKYKSMSNLTKDSLFYTPNIIQTSTLRLQTGSKLFF